MLKHNNIILNENETYNNIANEILKKENIKLVSYIYNFVRNRNKIFSSDENSENFENPYK